MNHKYPSSISKESFSKIEPLLNTARKKTKPRTIDLYDVFCGILYVLKSGCQWRMLPADFPTWQTCYAYWRKWNEKIDENPSLLEEALKKCGWRGQTKPWSSRENNFYNY